MSNDLNALRNSTDDFDLDFEDEEEDDGFLPDLEITEEEEVSSGPGFLGMTAGERLMLLVFFFANVALFAVVLLVATGRLHF